jgi:hypothetical protein
MTITRRWHVVRDDRTTRKQQLVDDDEALDVMGVWGSGSGNLRFC